MPPSRFRYLCGPPGRGCATRSLRCQGQVGRQGEHAARASATAQNRPYECTSRSRPPPSLACAGADAPMPQHHSARGLRTIPHMDRAAWRVGVPLGDSTVPPLHFRVTEYFMSDPDHCRSGASLLDLFVVLSSVSKTTQGSKSSWGGRHLRNAFVLCLPGVHHPSSILRGNSPITWPSIDVVAFCVRSGRCAISALSRASEPQTPPCVTRSTTCPAPPPPPRYSSCGSTWHPPLAPTHLAGCRRADVASMVRFARRVGGGHQGRSDGGRVAVLGVESLNVRPLNRRRRPISREAIDLA